MLSQWSMSEQDGLLRVASTTSPPWASDGSQQGESESFVTVLAPDGDRLRAVGRVGGLGRGEHIYAVRFIGDAGYVVTFRQVDPLYVLDLSDPAEAAHGRRAQDPRLLGLPAPGRSRPAARRGARGQSRRRPRRRPGLALRRHRPGGPRAPRPRVLRRRLDHRGRVRPSRLLLVRGQHAGDAADRRLHLHGRGLLRSSACASPPAAPTRSGAWPRSRAPLRSGARSSSAAACTPSALTASPPTSRRPWRRSARWTIERRARVSYGL